MTTHITNKREIRDGLSIYKRGDSASGIWYAMVHLGGNRYKHQSLKLKTEKLAAELARDVQSNVKTKLENQIPVTKRMSSRAIDAWLKYLDTQVASGQLTENMLRLYRRGMSYWRSYLIREPISALNDRHLEDYVAWRRANGVRVVPTNRTISMDYQAMRMFLNWAVKRNYLKHAPAFKFKAGVKKKRVAFTFEQYDALYSYLRENCNKSKAPRVVWLRQLLFHFVLALENSGLRVGEMRNLRWLDVEPRFDASGYLDHCQIRVAAATSKTRKARTVIPIFAFWIYLEEWQKIAKHTQPTDYVFAMPNGKRVGELREGFNRAVANALKGLASDAEIKAFTFYSLRHTYATRRLTESSISIYDLAKNMGTSVTMIEQYYGHSKIEDRAEMLTNDQ